MFRWFDYEETKLTQAAIESNLEIDDAGKRSIQHALREIDL